MTRYRAITIDWRGASYLEFKTIEEAEEYEGVIRKHDPAIKTTTLGDINGEDYVVIYYHWESR